MNNWDKVADDKTIRKTADALKANGMDVFVAGSGEEAKKKALSLIPKGAEVMTMTSVTVDTIGLAKKLNEPGSYESVRNKLMAMDRNTQGGDMQKLGAAPDWTVGSVHAVTQDGKIMVASNTGSQLPAYAYGSAHVLWIVGAQKIVPSLDAGMKRIHGYTFPLENARAQKAYGIESGVSKLLIVNKEKRPGRITVILVKEKLGF